MGDTDPPPMGSSDRERLAKCEERLVSGNKEFVAIRDELRLLRETQAQQARELAPKQMTRVQVFGFIAGPVLAVVVLIAGFAWQAARYPDRQEFDGARQAQTETARTAEVKLFELERAQALQARDISDITSATDRLEKTLDRLERALTAKGK